MKVRERFGLSQSEKQAHAALSYTVTPMDLADSVEGQPVEPPTEFRIFKAGINTSDKGNFVFDEKAALAVMAAYAKKANTLTMDYEHQALADPPIEAPASCSSWSPEVRKGELWATNVKWTPRAAGLIAAKEYSRFSPAFLHDPKTMRVLRILNVALTNLEALDGVNNLIAASQTSPGELQMKTLACAKCTATLKAPVDDEDGDEMYCKTCSVAGATATKASLLTLVGLKATTPDAEIPVELSAIAGFGASIMTLTGQTSRPAALGVIEAWKANAAEVAQLRAATAAAEETRIRTEFDSAINGAVAAGKVPPTEKDSLVALMGKPTADSLSKLTAYLSARTVVVSTTATAQNATGTDLITAEDIRLAKLTVNPAQTIENLRKFKTDQAQLATMGNR